MTRLAFIADPHIGNHKRLGGVSIVGLNERCRMAASVLGNAIAAAEKSGADALYILGDLFDTANPHPRVVSLVQNVLARSHIPIHVMTGNHDMISTDPDDHALGPLSHVDDVTVVDEPYVDLIGMTSVVMIPFRPGDARRRLRDDIAEAFETFNPEMYKFRILCLHLGIEHPGIEKYLMGDPSAVDLLRLRDLANEFGVCAVLAGHWHPHWRGAVDGKFSQWNNIEESIPVIQVGGLCPTGWNNPGLQGYGKVIIVDYGIPVVVDSLEIPGPRFISADSVQEAKQLIKAAPLDVKLFLELRNEPDCFFDDDTVEAFAALDQVHRVTVGVSPESASDRAVEAAASIRETESLEKAVASFVDGMVLDDGVDRKRVLSLSRTFLGLGAEEGA